MKEIQICELVYKKEIANGIFDFRVKSKLIAEQTKSGQFLHIDCGDGTLLRRPISVCDVEGDIVRFVFETKGKGTQDLAKKEVGQSIDILGPLGNGFMLSETYENPVIIGGGIGIFPLYNLAKHFDNSKIFLGFRTQTRVVMEDEFRDVGDVQISTDDGSYGYNGYAVTLFEKYIDENPCDIIFACGPMAMLKAVKAIAECRNKKCQLSLEQRMGCGIGACLVCTCETVHEGTEKYAKVCKDGPVFWSNEVTLNA